MFTKRHLSSFVMASLLMASIGACNDKTPTIQGARPLSSQPAAVPGQVTLPNELPTPADVLDTATAAAPDATAQPGMPRAALPTHEESGRIDEPVLVAPTPFVPDGAIGTQDGFPVFPAPGVVLPGKAPDASFTPPALPKPHCIGEAMTCERINAFGAEWFNNCSDQKGCSIDAVCRPRDTLNCGNVTDQAQCEYQGCTWLTPVPAAADAPKREWYDPRRLVDFVDEQVVAPALAVEQHLSGVRTGFRVDRVAVESHDNVVPSVCVAPEDANLAAFCNENTTQEECQSRDAICSWSLVGCGGTSQACDVIADQEACDKQIGCFWGVE